MRDKLAISNFFRLEAPEYFQFYYTMMHPTPGRQLLDERETGERALFAEALGRSQLGYADCFGLTKPTLALLFKWQLQIWSAETSKQTPEVHSEKGWGCTPTQGQPLPRLPLQGRSLGARPTRMNSTDPSPLIKASCSSLKESGHLLIRMLLG